MERLDSPSPAVRAIERWKRGLAAFVIVGTMTLGAAMIAALATAALELIGANTTTSTVTGMALFAVVAPWLIGGRYYLRQIGKLADAADE